MPIMDNHTLTRTIPAYLECHRAIDNGHQLLPFAPSDLTSPDLNALFPVLIATVSHAE